MTQQDLTDAFILWFSGAANMKNEREMWWEGQQYTTIEFPTNSPTYAILRCYLGATSWAQREVKDGVMSDYICVYPDYPLDYVTLNITLDKPT